VNVIAFLASGIAAANPTLSANSMKMAQELRIWTYSASPF